MITATEGKAFTIPLKPITKKNSQRIIKAGRYPRIVQSKAYCDYEKAAIKFCPAWHINEPINIEAHYYMPTRHRIDLTNLHAALHDIMVKAGTIEDDNFKIVVSTDGSRVHYAKDNPRTEIFITYISEEKTTETTERLN